MRQPDRVGVSGPSGLVGPAAVLDQCQIRMADRRNAAADADDRLGQAQFHRVAGLAER